VTIGRPARASLLVDARALNLGGIGRYLREILAHVLASPTFSHVTLLGNAADLRTFVEGHPSPASIEIVRHPGRLYSLRAQASWARWRLTGKAEASVAFFPHWDAPIILPPARSVVTVHDLIHFRVPDAFPRLRRAAARAVFRRVVSRAARVIVDSDWTRKDLLELEPGTREKLSVVPLGVSSEFHPPQTDEPLRRPVREPFLLCLGNKKRHKNLIAAVEVLARLLPTYPQLQLVAAGEAYEGWDEVLAGMTERSVREAVVDLPVVTDGELRVLYGRCAAFVFPSRYEGFGLPVLEAMACGAPVVASNASSIPEVTGQAGLLFDPSDVAGMASAVNRLIADPTHRATVTRLGRERALEFSWERTARRTVEILREVAEG
jgi:glycosyltransferase involved in cell wall biosynthesis